MKIEKGIKNGLPHFIELVSYSNNIKLKFIQIEGIDFCETPDGTRCFENTIEPIIISDKDNKTDYTDYCLKFNDSGIEETINDYLKIL